VTVTDVREAITRALHGEWAQVVAVLARRFGELDISEEAAADAFAAAVERWPTDGVPPNPGAWLTTTGNRKAIDRLRREGKRDEKQNEGYLATGPDTDPVRHDLTAEAIRLTRLIRALVPGDGEVAGLLALMLLTEARRTARVSATGELVTLDEQDREAWDAALIAEGHRLVRERLAAVAATGLAPGRYQILAAINAVHTSARQMRDTDWSQVVALYDQLVRLDPSPIVALNRAVAIAEIDGPEVALTAVDRLEGKLAGYHPYHVTRAELLRRLGRSEESRAA
jgi:predicted RNA polymerase sigma factor